MKHRAEVAGGDYSLRGSWLGPSQEKRREAQGLVNLISSEIVVRSGICVQPKCKCENYAPSLAHRSVESNCFSLPNVRELGEVFQVSHWLQAAVLAILLLCCESRAFRFSGMVLVEIWESLHSRCAAHRYSVAHIAISQVLMNHQLVQTKPACFRTMARCTTCTVAVQRHPQTKAFLCDNGARRLRYIYIARLSAYSLKIAIGDRPLVKERSVPTTNQTESKVPKWLR